MGQYREAGQSVKGGKSILSWRGNPSSFMGAILGGWTIASGSDDLVYQDENEELFFRIV